MVSFQADTVQPEHKRLTSEAREALAGFASALAETPQFRAFEEASNRLQRDEAAQQALRAYQSKYESLQWLLRLNAVGPDDRAELEGLQGTMMSEGSIGAYSRAQQQLAALCQAVADALSERIGLNYAAACRASGCC